MKTDLNNLWQFRKPKRLTSPDRFILLILVSGGIISILTFGEWWFHGEHVGNVFLFIVLSLAFWWALVRVIIIWINYLGLEVPEHKVAPKGLSVAIFTTSSPGEPLSMFEKTLEACAQVSYPHTTYLLDDTHDPAFRACAEKHGAVWLELRGIPGAKAGKINAALKLTKEDFILVLDPDHIPFPEFFEHTLGFFEDEKLGFVQVCQAYYNQYRSFTAAAAAEQTYTFYGPTQIALHSKNCTVAIGANCTFRRKALESIGGHGIGLAEDLITSIRLHAAGWKSIYNPVVVSRGLVPEDFGSFCKQQLKWSRGVFEVTFVELPKLFHKLSNWQRLSYFTIGTYYLVGATQFLFTLIPFLFFLSGILPANMSFAEFIIRGSFIVFFSMAIYLYIQRWLCHPQSERGLHWRGMILKYACWPVFTLGFVLSIVNADIPYIPTAKKAVTGSISPFARPLMIQVILFSISFISIWFFRRYAMAESELLLSSEKTWSMIAFAALSFIMALGGLYAAREARYLSEEEPWNNINVSSLKSKTHES